MSRRNKKEATWVCNNREVHHFFGGSRFSGKHTASFIYLVSASLLTSAVLRAAGQKKKFQFIWGS